uniref:Uncharacterized protein n=1 Tax=Arcella intermedia TaxID=1963864 RepID=A0A6B2LZ83_9EUKA
MFQNHSYSFHLWNLCSLQLIN